MRRSPLRFWILAALLAANLVVGVLSLYFIRSVNDRYAALFEDGAPAIYNLRTLTREVTGVQRLARRVTSPEHEPEWAELVPLMAEARERLDTRVHDVGTMAVFKDTPHPAAIRAISAAVRYGWIRLNTQASKRDAESTTAISKSMRRDWVHTLIGTLVSWYCLLQVQDFATSAEPVTRSDIASVALWGAFFVAFFLKTLFRRFEE